VQYWVLSSASQHSDVVAYSDNIRQLEGLTEEGVIESSVACVLSDAYRAYRRLGHVHALSQVRGNLIDRDLVGNWVDKVVHVWHDALG
jgi:glutamate-ammonia-ligase adenylyltransferase